MYSAAISLMLYLLFSTIKGRLRLQRPPAPTESKVSPTKRSIALRSRKLGKGRSLKLNFQFNSFYSYLLCMACVWCLYTITVIIDELMQLLLNSLQLALSKDNTNQIISIDFWKDYWKLTCYHIF